MPPLAPRLDRYPPIHSLSEAAIENAYLGPTVLARPCACGTVVIADPRDPAEGVSLHNASPAHQAWRTR